MFTSVSLEIPTWLSAVYAGLKLNPNSLRVKRVFNYSNVFPLSDLSFCKNILFKSCIVPSSLLFSPIIISPPSNMSLSKLLIFPLGKKAKIGLFLLLKFAVNLRIFHQHGDLDRWLRSPCWWDFSILLNNGISVYTDGSRMDDESAVLLFSRQN